MDEISEDRLERLIAATRRDEDSDSADDGMPYGFVDLPANLAAPEEAGSPSPLQAHTAYADELRSPSTRTESPINFEHTLLQRSISLEEAAQLHEALAIFLEQSDAPMVVAGEIVFSGALAHSPRGISPTEVIQGPVTPWNTCIA
jgi:hypothetical protein